MWYNYISTEVTLNENITNNNHKVEKRFILLQRLSCTYLFKIHMCVYIYMVGACVYV